MTRIRGVLAASLTPLHPDLSINTQAFADHCNWLLAHGCDGVALFGTTGEASSFSLVERKDALEGLLKAGLAPEKLLVGTGCCALPETVELTAHAVEMGCAGALVLPPFYYKTVHDQGLYNSYAKVIEGVGQAFNLYLYHFPQMSAVPLSHELIAGLIEDFPDFVVGIKDSSGDLAHIKSLVKSFPGLDVFSGSDTLLSPLLKAGAAGSITALSNVIAPLLARIKANPDHQEVQEMIALIRQDFADRPLTATLKGLIAKARGDEDWRVVRPPMVSVAPDQTEALWRYIAAAGYVFPC